MIDTLLVPEKTVATAKGDGPGVNVSSASSRVFLLLLKISDIIEQESLDIGVYGSPDGSNWGAKPIATFPQKFYRGQHPLLLDLTAHPEMKWLRAHWDVNRWGRGDEKPMFEFLISMKEVPPDVLKEAQTEARLLV